MPVPTEREEEEHEKVGNANDEESNEEVEEDINEVGVLHVDCVCMCGVHMCVHPCLCACV